MTGENQFAVYQMKQTPETRLMRFRSYKTLQEKGIRIRQEDYGQVYTGILHPQDTPESVRERLDEQLPRSFAGHSISVSDVLVFYRMGTIISYYVEKSGFTVIEDFIRNESGTSGSIVSIDTVNFHIEGKAESWLAFDSMSGKILFAVFKPKLLRLFPGQPALVPVFRIEADDVVVGFDFVILLVFMETGI